VLKVRTKPSSAPADEFASLSRSVLMVFGGVRLGLSLLPSRMPALNARRYRSSEMGDERDRSPSSDCRDVKDEMVLKQTEGSVATRRLQVGHLRIPPITPKAEPSKPPIGDVRKNTRRKRFPLADSVMGSHPPIAAELHIVWVRPCWFSRFAYALAFFGDDDGSRVNLAIIYHEQP
jgi:hypothetical protein